MTKTVLVLSPHPDDAEYYAGGTLVKFAREGARVIIVVVTDGRCGSFALDGAALIERRAAEARQGAAVLVLPELCLSGYPLPAAAPSWAVPTTTRRA